MFKIIRRGIAAGLAMLGLGCQVLVPVTPEALFALESLPQALTEPQGLDWSMQRVASVALDEQRAKSFQTLAYGAASPGWTDGGSPGLLLTSLGCTATDWVPNGPAAAYRTNPKDRLYNRVFFLTKEGKFIKTSRVSPLPHAAATNTLNLNKTFTKTNITLSPFSTRAYLLADDGTLFVVSTLTMKVLASVKPGGTCRGVSPFIDPYRSRHDDKLDILYFPDNNGDVWKYEFSAAINTKPTGFKGPVRIPVASSDPVKFAPLPYTPPMPAPFTGTERIAAPAVVLNGVIYVGTMSGHFLVVNTVSPEASLEFALGKPVTTPPALEIQDGTYALTDADGLPVTVARGTPIYAFVNAGPGCVFINMIEQSTVRSQTLVINDRSTSKTNSYYDFLLNYNYGVGRITQRLAAQDGGNLNTETPQQNLFGRTTPWYNAHLTPAHTNARAVAGAPGGGPVVSYMRWLASAGGAIVTKATLTMTPAFTEDTKVPEVRTTSSYVRGSTTTLWASNAITTANNPAIGAGNVGTYLGGVGKTGNVRFKANAAYNWDVTAAFPTLNTDNRYALALSFKSTTAPVWWQLGPYQTPPGKPKLGEPTMSLRLVNNALNADSSPAKNNDKRPILTLELSTASLPAPSIETAPVINAWLKRVYVFYTNTLYAISYASPTAFEDSEAATGGAKYTLFNMTRRGIDSGATFNNLTAFVGNEVTPVLNYNGSAMFLLDRYPSPANVAVPTAYQYSLSKMALPLVATGAGTTAGKLVTGTPNLTPTTTVPAARPASVSMIVDPFTGVKSTGGNVYFGLGNGRVYQYDAN